jgi:hypothetical protein
MRLFQIIGKDKRGQALPLALAALAVGALLIAPFLSSVSAHSISSGNYRDSALQVYSSGAGIEDAIWRLTDGDLAGTLTDQGDTASYTMPYAVNGIQPEIEIVRVGDIIESYAIVSTAEMEKTSVEVVVDGGGVTINYWHTEREI